MRKAKRLQREVDDLRLCIMGPDGLRQQLSAARLGERMEWRMRADAERRATEAEGKFVQVLEALEALVDVQPYLYANPDHPSAKEWEGRRERALNQAAAALDATAGEGGYRVK